MDRKNVPATTEKKTMKVNSVHGNCVTSFFNKFKQNTSNHQDQDDVQKLVEQLKHRVAELEQEREEWIKDTKSASSFHSNKEDLLEHLGSGLSSSMKNAFIQENNMKEGVLARPKGQERCKMKCMKKSKKWFFKKAKAKKSVKADPMQDQAMELFGTFTVLGEAMKITNSADWDESNYTSAAKLVLDMPVPRVSLDALKLTLKDSSAPVCIMTDGTEKGPPATSITPELFDKIMWANQAELDWWGIKSIQESSDFHIRQKQKKFVKRAWQNLLDSVFEDGDVQPKRTMYYKYGSGGNGVYSSATPHIMQNGVMLMEEKGTVYLAIFLHANAPKKYDKEIVNIVMRSHALFKYTDSALTIFTTCGTIVQQNPVSISYLGMAASENVIYTDVDNDGKPVNRLRSLFGDNETSYNDMWNAINENDMWSTKRMQVYKKDLKPFRNNQSKSFGSSAFDAMDLAEASAMDAGIWIYMQVIPFMDPSDGIKTLYVMFKDITKTVLQEEKVREAKKHEHEILESIIPAHIIDILTEEKRSQTLSKSSKSDSTSSSERFLSLSAIRNAADSRANGLAEHHEDVTIFFADVVGFTKMSSQSSPARIMNMLNELFTLFDDYTEEHNIYKVETIGDSYMCVAGLNLKSEREKIKDKAKFCENTETCAKYHARRMLGFAKDVLKAVKTVESPCKSSLQIRIGLHSGDCMTGIVGYKMPRFCLFGDTVNTASRMESNGKPGYIHASKATRDFLEGEPWVATGGIEAKGKGVMETYLLKP